MTAISPPARISGEDHAPVAKTIKLAALLIAAFFALLPAVLYRQFLGLVPSVTVENAKEILAEPGTSAIPFRESPALEQWAVVVTGFGVKPLYTVLALLLVVVSASKVARPGCPALGHTMFFHRRELLRGELFDLRRSFRPV